MADLIKVCALGGLDENGRDCYVIEINDDIFVVDCGCSLPDKNIPGVDFILPNAEYLIANKNRVRAYLITHGHDEAMAALKYFYDVVPAPIYCSSATASLIVGQARMHSMKPKFNFVIVEASSESIISGRKVTFFQTCHNAAYSSGVAINTDKGNIVFTSDYMIDYTANEKGYTFDFSTVGKIAKEGVFLLMSESKSASKAGYCSPNHRVKRQIEKYFKDSDKRIFISCFWENSFRIDEIISLCRSYKKKLYFFDDYTREVCENYAKGMPGMFSSVDIVMKEDLLRVRKQDVVILILGHNQELYTKINALALEQNDDRRLVLEKEDIFINAALATPTLETLCTHAIDNVYRTGCFVVWLKSKNVTSMHAHQDDLKYFLNIFMPKYYLPVRGNFVNMMANARLALSMEIGLNHTNVFVLDNGMQLSFDSNGKASIIPNEVNKINIAPVLVDGTGFSKVGVEVVEDRLKLSQDGIVVIASTISLSKKDIIAGPDCQMRGFVFVKEAEPLLKSISNIYVEEIRLALLADKVDIEKIKEQIVDRATKFIKRDNGREPYILPIINVIE